MRTESGLGFKIALGFLLLATLLLAAFALAQAALRTTTAPGGAIGSPAADTMLWAGGLATLTLEDAATQANVRAAMWASDAVLVRASGSWRPGSGWMEITMPPLAWSFAYYSPGEGKQVSVGVSDDEVFWGAPRLVPAPIPPLRTFPPAFGPDTAWLAFRAADGDRFLRRNPQALVGLRLVQEGDTPVWRVTVTEDNAYLLVRINAETGLVIDTQ